MVLANAMDAIHAFNDENQRNAKGLKNAVMHINNIYKLFFLKLSHIFGMPLSFARIRTNHN